MPPANAAAVALQPLIRGGYEGIVLTTAQVGRYLRRFLETCIPRIAVLSHNEIDPAVRLTNEGRTVPL